MVVSFSEDLDDFSLRLRAEAVPTTPKASILRVEEGSGTANIGLISGGPLGFPTGGKGGRFLLAKSVLLTLSIVKV